MIRRFALLSSVALVGCDAGPAPVELARVEQATVEDGTADRVFGQPTLDVGAEPAVVSERSTHFPSGVGSVAPSLGGSVLWIADRDANRVIGIDRAMNSPTIIGWYLVGQGAWNQRLPNAGGPISAASLNQPTAVATRASFLAVADTGNHRVLFGNGMSGGAWAQTVFGQADFTTGERNMGGAVTAATLSDPAGVAFDVADDAARLFVADGGNHRVTVFSLNAPIDTTAKQCLGQADCESGLPNRGGAVSRTSLNDPHGLDTWNVIGDPLRGLYVADTGNHRVLHYPALSTVPDLVYGQDDDFTTAIPSKGGPSARSLRSPSAVAVDADGSLWVADTGHHRVLHFPKGKTIADRVLGQPNMTSAAPPVVASPSALRAPQGIAVTLTSVIVADTGFSRVVRFSRACDLAACDDGDICTDEGCTALGCSHAPNTFPAACRGNRCSKNACTPCSTTPSPAGCRPGYLCLDGSCVLRCSSDAQCAALGGKCVDGYCCDRACDGPCESCAQRGRYGRCTPVAGLPQGGRTCSGTDVDCGARCDGVDGSRCHGALVGAVCGVEICVDGVAQSRGTCVGDGTCTGEKKSCAPYGCDVGGCFTSCRHDYQCAKDASCVSGECVAGAGLSPGGGCAFGAPSAGKFALLAVVLALAGVLRRRR